MTQRFIPDTKTALEEAFAFFREELSKLRTSRAASSLVEDLVLEYFGSKVRIKEVAAITLPSPQSILIQPWDKNALEGIARAISNSPLELSPVVDRDAVRLMIPPLSEERRKDLSKIVNEKAEEMRIRIRQKRDDVLKDIERQEKAKEMSEDEKFRAKEDLQELVDEYNERVKTMQEEKEKEIMTV